MKTPKSKSEISERDARLAEQLRENLRRRKAVKRKHAFADKKTDKSD
ncbi:MAG: hypothetical protein ABJ275_06110 [Maricaulaceae bacterium]